LVITSKPVVVKAILSKHNPQKSLLISAVMHVVILVCILVLDDYVWKDKKPASSSEVFVISSNNIGIYLPPLPKRGGGGGGIGPGSGLGIGPGSGGGAGGDVFGVGNGVIAPRILRKIDPEYSDEARKARRQGTVVLYVEIDTDGNVRKIEVHRGLGMGLDKKAVGVVKQWKFSPGMKKSQPVIVGVIVEIIFRLL